MDELLHLLQELHPEIDFMEKTALVDEGVLDSFDIVTLIGELNDKMGISIAAEDIIPENFNSYEAIYSLVKKLIEE